MAYGKFLSYEPGPAPGSYMFAQDGGSPVLLAGAPAENLRARLDASANLAGQKVAGPGGAPEPAMSAAPVPAMSTAPPPEPAMSVAPQTPTAPGPLAPTVENAHAAMAEQPQNVAQPAALPGPQAVAINGINIGYLRMPDGTLRAYQPGTAALTPAKLRETAAQGVAMPHSASETTQGGFTPSADYLATRENLAIDKEQLADAASDAEAAAASRDQALAAQQAHDAAALKAQEQARANEIETRYKRDEATKDKLLSDYGSARVDPHRVFSGAAGTARGVLGVLGAALGQAGSGMLAMGGHPGQPNLAFQAFNSMIDRDIAAQENEIKVKGAMADNALTQFQRTGLSLDQAKSALRAAQLQWGSAQLQQNAAISKGAQVDANRGMMMNSIQSALNDANEDYRQKSLGTITKQVASQVQYPHAGSAGGYRQVAPKEAMGLISQSADLGAKNAGTTKTLADAELAESKARASAQPPQASAELHSAIDNLDIAAAQLGFKPGENGYAGAGHGVWRNDQGWFQSDASREFKAALRAAAPQVLAAQGSKRLSSEEIDKWVSNAIHSDADQVKSFLDSQKRALQVKQMNEQRYPKKSGVVTSEPANAEVENE